MASRSSASLHVHPAGVVETRSAPPQPSDDVRDLGHNEYATWKLTFLSITLPFTVLACDNEEEKKCGRKCSVISTALMDTLCQSPTNPASRFIVINNVSPGLIKMMMKILTETSGHDE